jgi:hypothetical protein
MGEYSDINGHFTRHVSEEDAYKEAKEDFGEHIVMEKQGKKTIFKRPDGKQVAEYTEK